MFETHTSTTYDEAFARARKERAEAFRAMFAFFRLPKVLPGRRSAAA
ncbi:hypothetical protein [Jannaschia donghaensis]|uniref:Uncharacterized protein n=1 Tax=Jannaschia donghaensis TaxID=420998 RepID=A0A0M6YE63_9RHOB|nr:hypothetical protein [Jannaschia donghaensis]CTQ48608.1 hypothetical protein JDO7802_00612 [Jannaschia donghaensis]